MALNYVTVTGTFDDGSGTALNGTVTFTPSETVYAAGIPVVSTSAPVVAQVINGALKSPTGGTLQLLATDNSGVTLEGLTGFWFWNVVISVSGDGQSWSFFLPGSPSTVDLYSLANTVSGGGFPNPMTTLGDTLYEGSSGPSRLAGSTASTKKFLAQTGTGSASAAPAWGTIAAADLPAGTTSAQGAVQYDATAADLQPTGTASTGKTPVLKVVYADHVHPYEPWQFYVAPLGGGTDDTANLRTAWNAAWNYAANNQGKAQMFVDPALYTLASATIKNTTIKGNSQLPIPVYGTGVSGPVVELRCTGGTGAVNPMFGQSVPQLSGAIFSSTLTGLSQDGTFGEPSVIGGPTPAQGYGQAATLFNNCTLIIDGITIVTPNNPTICGVDMRGQSKTRIHDLAVLVNAAVGSIAAPTSAYQFGLAMPENGNNDNCFIGQYTAYGQNYGVQTSEHTYAQTVRCINCIAGIEHGGGDNGATSSTAHWCTIEFASVEACQVSLGAIPAGYPSKISVKMLDWEGGSSPFTLFKVIKDASSRLLGDVTVNSNAVGGVVSASNINGALNLCIYDATYQSGPMGSPPSAPSSTNPSTVIYRNAVWYVSAASGITGISIDSTATGLTAAAGAVIPVSVPSGHTFTPTYSGAMTVHGVVIS